jgi:hypothetical protein
LATGDISFPGIPGIIAEKKGEIIIIIEIIVTSIGTYCSPEPVDANLHSAFIVSSTSYEPQFPIRAVPKMDGVNTYLTLNEGILFVITRLETKESIMRAIPNCALLSSAVDIKDMQWPVTLS